LEFREAFVVGIAINFLDEFRGLLELHLVKLFEFAEDDIEVNVISGIPLFQS
jgi:hypothetical protein